MGPPERFLRSNIPRPNYPAVSFRHAQRPQAIPDLRPLPLHHLHLLPPPPVPQRTTTSRHVFRRETLESAPPAATASYVFGYVLMPEHVHLLLSEPKLHLTRRQLSEPPQDPDLAANIKGDRKTSPLAHPLLRPQHHHSGRVPREKLSICIATLSKPASSRSPKTGPGAAIATGSPASAAASKSNRTGHGAPARSPE